MNALAFAGDDGVAVGLAVAIHSAVRHLRSDAEVVVLDAGLSDESRRRLSRVCSGVRWVVVPSERLNGMPAPRYLTVGAYARLLIPELLPDVDRAVYLDADVLVRKDLSPLFALDLGDAPVGGVRDFETPIVAERPSFNSGVLVLDCDRWRATDLGPRVLAYVEAHKGDLRNPDQQALNAVNSGWLELDWSWNVQQALRWAERIERSELTDTLVSQRASLYAEAAVIHFTSTPKPWYHSSNAPGTWPWVASLIGSGYYRPFELARWLGVWLARRIARGMLVALRLRPTLD